MKSYNLLILFYLLGFIACKNESKQGSETSNQSPIIGAKSNEVKEVRAPYVKAVKIDPTFEELVKKQAPYPMITDSVWKFYIGITLNSQKPTQYDGEWLDLIPSGKYLSGKREMQLDSGLFYYNDKMTTLEMRSFADSSSEWRVKVDPDAMLLIGTEKYANNPWQIKLKRRFSSLTK